MLLLREFVIFDGLPLQILHHSGSEQYNVVTEAAGKVKKLRYRRERKFVCATSLFLYCILGRQVTRLFFLSPLPLCLSTACADVTARHSLLWSLLRSGGRPLGLLPRTTNRPVPWGIPPPST